MTISEIFLAELRQEAEGTRRLLERVPDDKLSWRPHEKSFHLGRLAGHIAEIPGWVAPTLHQPQLDMADWDAKPFDPASRAELMEGFERQLADAIAAFEKPIDNASYGEPWSLLQDGQAFFTMPKSAVIRAFVLNHIVHHRGQLTVYLRENDVPLPSIYGPSADES